jgi:hypothetical protein
MRNWQIKKVKLHICTDSAAGKSMATRLGSGRQPSTLTCDFLYTQECWNCFSLFWFVDCSPELFRHCFAKVEVEVEVDAVVEVEVEAVVEVEVDVGVQVEVEVEVEVDVGVEVEL